MKHRLLYLPMGPGLDDGIGFRRAFDKLVANNTLADLQTFHYCREVEARGGWQAMLDHLVATAATFAPTAIMWQLQTTGEVPAGYVRRLRSLPSLPVIIQFTGDSYRRAPKNMIRFGREIDATFLHGTHHIPAFRKGGCQDVRFLTHWFSLEQWATSETPSPDPEFDVIMIANFYRQLPFRRYDGQRDRMELVKAFTQRYGKRFAIYGEGWNDHPCAKGFVAKEQQQQAMQNSRIVLAANNWHHANYFSDRLPISLTSRVPVLHKWFEGADDHFQDGKHLWWFRDTEEALNKAERILAMPPAVRDAVTEAGAAEAIRNHSCDKHAQRFVDVFDELYARRCEQREAS